jgi:two-component system, OmpR family, response regulator MprA
MTDAAKVLIIEDDVNIADFIKRGLAQKGYDTKVSFTGLQGLEIAKNDRPDLVILDLILPDVDGIDVCREMRSWGDIGIIILTARHMLGDRILGLEAGADDYLPKPFALEELIARIRSLLRRKKSLTDEVIRISDLEIDLQRRQVKRGSRLIELTTREFDISRRLAENAGKPVRREIIYDRIWGDEFEAETDPVKVYINFIRRKINSRGEIDLIHSLRGYGYALEGKA